MIEDSTITPEEVKTVGQKVLAIERVILRRAWALARAKHYDLEPDPELTVNYR